MRFSAIRRSKKLSNVLQYSIEFCLPFKEASFEHLWYENTAHITTLPPPCCRRDKHFALSSICASAIQSHLVQINSMFFCLENKKSFIFLPSIGPSPRPSRVVPWCYLALPETSLNFMHVKSSFFESILQTKRQEAAIFRSNFTMLVATVSFLPWIVNVTPILRR